MDVLYAADWGVVPGGDPLLCEKLTRMLQDVQEEQGSVIQFAPGAYHFYPDSAPKRAYHISNHDQDGVWPTAFLLEKIRRLTIDGGGGEFIFHAELLPVCLTDCDEITLRNFSIDYAQPVYSEGEILSADEREMILRIDPVQYPWLIKDGTLLFPRESHCYPLHLWLEFDAASGAPAWGTDDLYFCTETQKVGLHPHIKALSEDTVQLTLDEDERFFAASRPGNRLVFRHHPRSYPAVYATDSKQVTLENIQVHHSVGIGFLAERCEDVRLLRFAVVPNPKHPRCFTACADGAHFVSCGGCIRLQDCVFEKQLDDCVNIHGFYTPVREKLDKQILRLGWGHAAQAGTPPARPGDTIILMDSRKLRPIWTGILRRLDVGKDTMLAEFDRPLPEFLPESAVLENLTLSPSVLIQRCVFRKNRARGILLTCKEALVEECEFEVPGAAVYLEGEAQYWYESGSATCLRFHRNQFVNCAYIPAWGAAPVTACPKVEETPGWFFHGRLELVENIFCCFDQRRLSLRHVGEVYMENNCVCPTHAYPPQEGVMYDLQQCGALIEHYACGGRTCMP